MPSVDAAFADQVLTKLAALPEDVKPEWGSMNRAQLFGHLNIVVRYMFGDGQEMPFRGNFVSKNLFRPLILNGVVKIPRNIRLPKPKGMKEMPPPPEATYEEFEASLKEYVSRLENGGDLPNRTHPFFGVLNKQQWAKFHWNHFRHHLTQFGVWDD